MASQTINGQAWAEGTVVSVYPAASWPDPSRSPSGSVVTSATVSGGSVTFSSASLLERVRYVAYAAGKGVGFVVPQRTPETADGLRKRLDDLEGDTLPAVETRVGVLEGPTFRPEDFGYVDGTNMDVALRAAVTAAAAAGGGTVAGTPGKTYDWGSTAVITSQHNVTLDFRGAKIKRVAGILSPDVATFGNWQSCDNLRLFLGEIDCNGIERFGGFQINDCADPLVTGVRADDSNLNASWITYDHYLFVFNAGCTNVKMYDCEAKNVELVEADKCQGFSLDRFYSEAAAGTTGLGLFTVVSGETATDYKITNGAIVDPRKRGLSITHETGGPNNNVWKRFTIQNVSVKKLSTVGGVSSLFTIGNAGGAASSGNTYEEFILENILVLADPALVATGTATTVSGTPDLTLVTPTTKWQDNMPVSGAGIPAGTTIVSGAGTAHMVMSQNASASAAGVTITGSPVGRPLFSINPSSGHNFERARLKNINVVGDCGGNEYAADIRYLSRSTIDGLHVNNCQLGANLQGFTDSRVRGLEMDATVTDGQVSASLGSNVFEVAKGTLGIAGLHATDKVVDLGDIAGGVPWRQEINVFTTPITQTNFNTRVQAAVLMGGRLDSSGAQNDAIGWDIVLSAGTWELSMIHSKGADRGIYTFSLDGVSVGTVDGYSAGTVNDSVATSLSATITVATTGKKRLLCTMATKNASSSSFFGRIQGAISLRRTA